MSQVEKATIAVIIPTLNAEGEIGALLDSIEGQSMRPAEVIVVDSDSDDATREIVRAHRGVTLLKIDRGDFNHGLTRDMALRRTRAEFVCFMTQDAVPADDRLFESLLAPMAEDPDIALVTARQLPKPSARRFEQLVRAFNYPNERRTRDMSDVPRCGIKAFFASDVCSLYRRSAYLSCGGFREVVTYEDLIMAASLIGAGLKVSYEPTARVYHSHNLTPRQQFIRNREGGMCLQEHKGELLGASEVGEGGRLVRAVSAQLIKEGRFGELAAFAVDCAARLAGNRMGRRDVRKGKAVR